MDELLGIRCYFTCRKDGTMVLAAILIIFPLCMAVTVFSDTLSMTIPDRVSVILLGAFVLLAALSGMRPLSIGLDLLCGAAVFAVCFVLFALGVMGGGDAKVLTASSVWFGFSSALMTYFVTISLIGGLLAVVFVLVRSRCDLLMSTRLPLPAHFYDTKAGVPYGIAIGIAGLICYPQSPLMLYALGQLAQ